MVHDYVHEFLYTINLSTDVDYYNVILQMQIDLRCKFEYHDKQIIAIKLPSRFMPDRLSNVTVWKNSKEEPDYMQKQLYYPNINDSKYDNITNDDYYDKEDIEKMRKQYKDFQLFKNEFELLNKEKYIIDGLLNHPLIKDLIVTHEWIDTMSFY